MSLRLLPRFRPTLVAFEIPQDIAASARDPAAIEPSRRQKVRVLLELLAEFEMLRTEYEQTRELRPAQAEEHLAHEISDCLTHIDQSLRALPGLQPHPSQTTRPAWRIDLLCTLKRNIYRINNAFSPTPISPLRLPEFAQDPRQSRNSTWWPDEDHSILSRDIMQ
jgi:uncharacterized membrane protein YccC